MQPMANLRARAGLIGSFAIVLSVPLLAQPIPPASIADKELGWIKVYNFAPATEPLKVDTRVYSTAQRNIAVDLANWIQASYSPIGGLGDVVRTFPRLSGAVPQSYGVVGRIYDSLKYGANGKIEPYTGDGYSWNVMVNGAFGRSAEAINTPEARTAAPSPLQDGFSEAFTKAVICPAIRSSDVLRVARELWHQRQPPVRLLCRRRTPAVREAHTSGEYLGRGRVAITRTYEVGQEEALRSRAGGSAANRALDWAHRGTDGEAKAGPRSEPGEVQEPPPGNGRDLDRRARHLARGLAGCVRGERQQPLALPVIRSMPRRWSAANPIRRNGSSCPGRLILNNPVSKHLYDAVVDQFNMEYIYNRFFDPENVKGLPYKPRPARAATVAADASAPARRSQPIRACISSKTLRERRSANPPRLEEHPHEHRRIQPRGGTERTGGIVGLWSSGFTVSPRQLKGPLPPDFTVSFDLVAARDYTWGTKGDLQVSKGSPTAATTRF